jgi:hypothetical protein
MQIQRPKLVIVPLTILLCVVVYIPTITYAPNQIIQNASATNITSTSSTSTNGSNITLGTPQVYTEYDKTTSFKPAIVNGTHGTQITFTGHGIMNGINITDNGNAFLTNSSGGAIYTTGRGTAFHGFTFQAIGHHGADGKLRDFGTIFNTKGMVGIYKDEIEKNGNAITKVWLWK